MTSFKAFLKSFSFSISPQICCISGESTFMSFMSDVTIDDNTRTISPGMPVWIFRISCPGVDCDAQNLYLSADSFNCE